MKKHPNEFTRRQIMKYFSDRRMEVEVTAVGCGYVIFFQKFSANEACTVEDPAGKLVYEESRPECWKLFWMSGRFRWHLYDRYEKVSQALDVMFSDKAANLFHNVL
jgi:hypothetical protein